jgi:hypothetical protein
MNGEGEDGGGVSFQVDVLKVILTGESAKGEIEKEKGSEWSICRGLDLMDSVVLLTLRRWGGGVD